jgi:DNA-binding transcriptional LysR family regulator
MANPKTDFDWNHMRAFLATAEEGSLSAAARRLGLTQPTLGRQVSALEEELNLMLFERVGRNLQLTTAGTELLHHVQAMQRAADQVSLVATGQSQTIEGLVRITASEVFSAYLLPPILEDLRTRAPQLEIEIVASNDLRDLMRREADIAIRHVRPDQPDLIARLVNEADAYFYAATRYLDRKGRPNSVEDLADHEFLNFGTPERMVGFYKPLGFPVTEKHFRMGSENGVVAWELLRQGFGIAAMMAEVGRVTPGVEQILPQMDPIKVPIWLTTHRELHTSPKIRLVFDVLAEHLGKKGVG